MNTMAVIYLTFAILLVGFTVLMFWWDMPPRTSDKSDKHKKDN